MKTETWTPESIAILRNKMTELILYEIRKLLAKRSFFLVVLIVISALLISFYSRIKTENTVTEQQYQAIRSVYGGLPPDQQEKELSRIGDGLSFVAFRENYLAAGYSDTEIEDLLSFIPEQYGTDCNSFIDEFGNYSLGGYGKEDIQAGIRMILDQLKYTEIYEKYIGEFSERAEELKKISLFSGTDSFAYRRIEKSERDFGRLGHPTINPDYDVGINMLFQQDAGMLFVTILILAAVTIIFTDDRECGMLPMLKATRNGHVTLSAAKLLTAVGFSVIVTFFLQSVKVVMTGLLSGFGDLQRSIQSVPCFRECCYRITAGDFLVLYVCLPCEASIVCAIAASLLYQLSERTWKAGIIYTVWISVSWTAYRLVPENSAFSFWKYVNLFALSDAANRFGTYANINLFGFPAAILPAESFAVFLISGLCITVCLLEASGKIRRRKKQKRVYKRKTVIHGTTNLVRQEGFRLGVMQFGIPAAVLILLGCIFIVREENFTLSESQYWYYTYGNEINGELTEQTGQWFTERFDELADEDQAIMNALQHAYAEETGTEPPGLIRAREHEQKMKWDAYNKLCDEYARLRVPYDSGVPVHYISGIITDRMFTELRQYLLFLMMAISVTFFIVSPTFTNDIQTGMEKLVSTTVNGRKRVFLTRYAVMALFGTVIYSIAFGAHLYICVCKFGMRDFNAPVQSVLNFVDLKLRMSVGQYTMLWFASGFVSMLTFICLVSVMSLGMKKSSSVQIVSTVILIVDFLFSILKIRSVMKISVSSGFSLPMITAGESGDLWLMIVLIKNPVILSGIFLGHSRRFSEKNQRKRG